jgi:putative glycosyltransferase (TIGR04372 family)
MKLKVDFFRLQINNRSLTIEYFFKKQLYLKLFKFILFFPILVFIRLLSPLILFRFGPLISSRIGHFAGNTELYFCEKKVNINVPKKRHYDFFYFQDMPISNFQLASMWKRTLNIGPFWLISPITSYISYLPGGSMHLIGNNTQHDRDVHNLLDKYPSKLSFTDEEEEIGQNALISMGIPPTEQFVCFLVRDKEYLSKKLPGIEWDYHSYRDCSIENFGLAALELVSRGYYVIRMGAVVEKPFPIDNPKIIDYGYKGLRSDFMDIYLGAKCHFCVTTGAGWDNVPSILFRKPIVYTNFVPFGNIHTFRSNFICISKKHFDLFTGKELSLSQIFERGVGYCMKSKDYAENGVILIENTQEEICDVVLEMEERLKGNFKKNQEYLVLQSKFWALFPNSCCDERGVPLHGEILGSFGYKYLKNNQDWII